MSLGVKGGIDPIATVEDMITYGAFWMGRFGGIMEVTTEVLLVSGYVTLLLKNRTLVSQKGANK